MENQKTTIADFQSVWVDVEALQPSPFNPRGELSETKLELKALIESVKEKGVLEPIIVRQVNSHLEVVAGSRRVAAAKAAGLKAIPGVIRALDDQAAREVAIIENLHRKDLHPLEEAEGFQRLMDTGLSREQAAGRVGVPAVYFNAQLSLNNLIDKVRDPFRVGNCDLSFARKMGRLTKETQLEAWKILKQWGGVLTVGQLDRVLDEYVYRQLEKAPFDPEDAQLVPAAGKCSECPKRSGAKGSLFPDIKAKDTCTDAVCWNKKAAAVLAATQAQFPNAVKIVVDGADWRTKEEARKRGYLVQTYEHGDLGKGEWKPSSKGACESTVDAIVAIGPDFGKHRLVCTEPRCPVHGAPAKARATSGVMNNERAKQQEDLWKRRTSLAKRKALHAALREEMQKRGIVTGMPLEVLRYFVHESCDAIKNWGEARDYVASLHGKEGIGTAIEKAKDTTALLVVWSDMILGTATAGKFDSGASLYDVAKAYKLDVEKITGPVEREWNEKKAATYKRREERLAREKAKLENQKQKKGGAKRTPVEAVKQKLAAQAKELKGALHTGDCCRYCGCTEDAACLDGLGEPCSWVKKPRKLRGKDGYQAGVCSAEKCATQFRKDKLAAKKAKQ